MLSVLRLGFAHWLQCLKAVCLSSRFAPCPPLPRYLRVNCVLGQEGRIKTLTQPKKKKPQRNNPKPKKPDQRTNTGFQNACYIKQTLLKLILHHRSSFMNDSGFPSVDPLITEACEALRQSMYAANRCCLVLPQGQALGPCPSGLFNGWI